MALLSLSNLSAEEPLINIAAMEAVADAAAVLVREGVLSDKPALSAITNLTILSRDHVDLLQKA